MLVRARGYNRGGFLFSIMSFLMHGRTRVYLRPSSGGGWPSDSRTRLREQAHVFVVRPAAAFEGCKHMLVRALVVLGSCLEEDLRFALRNQCCGVNVSRRPRGSF